MNNRKKGSQKETLAAAYLQRYGVMITCQNYRIRQGEIDLIGWENIREKVSGREQMRRTLLFVEVKYRKNHRNGVALEAVTVAKQKQICRVSLFYLNQYHISDNVSIRYDVVAIDREGDGDKITWIKNAFPFMS